MKYRFLYITSIYLSILFLGIISSPITYATDDISVNVISTNYQYQDWGQYPLINFFGEKDVPLFQNNDSIWKSNAYKLAKLLQDSDDIWILKSGEELDLGYGYGLYVKQLDVSNNEVWFELHKDGQYVDDHIVYINNGGDNTWTCTLDKILGEDDVPVLKVHVCKLYKDEVDSAVQLDGIWLIDFANVKEIYINTQYESYTVKVINSGVDASNLGSIIFVPYSPSPYADFKTSTSDNAPLKVSFSDTSKETPPTSWLWDFGDGATSTDENPTHIYTEAGNYQVTLTVSNANGTTTNSHLVEVANGQTQTKPTEQLTPTETAQSTPYEEITPEVTPTGQSRETSIINIPNLITAIIAGTILWFIHEFLKGWKEKRQQTLTKAPDNIQPQDNSTNKKGIYESQEKDTANVSAHIKDNLLNVENETAVDNIKDRLESFYLPAQSTFITANKFIKNPNDLGIWDEIRKYKPSYASQDTTEVEYANSYVLKKLRQIERYRYRAEEDTRKAFEKYVYEEESEENYSEISKLIDRDIENYQRRLNDLYGN